MAQGIYIAMNGAITRAQELDTLSSNLVNAETPGFKAQRLRYESFHVEGVEEGGQLVRTADAGFDLRPGVTKRTDRPLDLLPEKGRFFAVQMDDGSTAYTRDGRVEVDAEGRLFAAGRPLLGESGAPIAVPFGSVPVVQEDGSVLVLDTVVDRVALYELDGELDRVGASLLSPRDLENARQVTGRVRTGEIELASFTPLEATVAMVGAQRSFDQAMKAIETYSRLDERAAEIGRVRG